MIMSQEKMDSHYTTFVSAMLNCGGITDANMKKAFELVTADMMREVRDVCKNDAFAAANAISVASVK